MNNQTWPYHDAEEIETVANVLRSGKTNYWTGEEGKSFEKEFAEFIGTKYAIALMNGTVALEAALYALDIGLHDEVITTCRTFIASASAVVMRGAIPKLCDVDKNSQNMTAETIEPLITSRTKAIIVVHLAGWPCDMPSILKLAEKYHLKVIEDCAQAHGAAIDNKKVGSWGDVAAFSFCQDKIMTTGGEGGMVTTNNSLLWEKIWSFKDHGKSYNAVYQRKHPIGFRWLHESFGTNLRMTELQASIGRLQLKKLPGWVITRNRNATILTDIFSGIPALRIPSLSNNISHAYYKYYVFLRTTLLKPGWTRDKILARIISKGIPCFSGVCSDINEEKAFTQSSFYAPATMPISSSLGKSSLMFLVHPTLTANEIQKTATTVAEIIMHASVQQEILIE